MSFLAVVGQTVVAVLVSVGLAAGLGLVSRTVYVAGLWPLAVGLAAGGAAAFAALVFGGWPGRGARVAATLAAVLGCLTLVTLDDLHFRAAFRGDVAAARFADSGAAPTEALEDDELDFFAQSADELLDAQARRETGHGGFVGRWLLRAEAGVRLFGSWDASRGLGVGVPGALVWAVLELILAIAVAFGVIRRVERRLAGPGGSDREAPDLDGESHP